MNDETIDYDSMDDDAFLAASGDLPVSEPVESIGAVESEEEPVETEAEEEGISDEDTQTTDSDTDETEDDTEDSEDEQEESESENTDADTDDDDGDQETDTDTEDDEEDYKALYEGLLAPFKANGKEMQVDSVEDARRLMQMGAGSAKQMQKLKPHLKIVKSLKDNDLLDQDKLNHLIDVASGNPEAIAKLIKDSGINPLDIDTNETGDYKPKNYEVSDTAVDLEQAIENIRGEETFERAMDVMGNEWDAGSREIISEHPEIVGVINDHIGSGVFDVVSEYVDREKTLGRMAGMSDIEAYREAADTLTKNGTLVNGQVAGESEEEGNNENSLAAEAEKVKKQKQSAKIKKKKKAAAPSKGGGGSKHTPDLSKLSDEEFLREFEKL